MYLGLVPHHLSVLAYKWVCHSVLPFTVSEEEKTLQSHPSVQNKLYELHLFYFCPLNIKKASPTAEVQIASYLILDKINSLPTVYKWN